MDVGDGYGKRLRKRPVGLEDPVTKEQTAAFLYRIMDEDELPPSGFNAGIEYKDLDDVSDWAYMAVYTLNRLGIFNIIPGVNFNPQTPATRAEMASILYEFCFQVFERNEGDGGDDIEEKAFYIIGNLCEETINHLGNGMIAVWLGDYEIIDGEICWKIALGTGHSYHFVTEFIYAVGSEFWCVYRYDFLDDVWIPLDMG